MAGKSTYTTEKGGEICAMVSEGQSLRSICASKDMPNMSTIFKWIGDHPAFSNQYAQAKSEQLDKMADEMLDIADDSENDYMERKNKDGTTYEAFNGENVQRSRLRIDSRKWLLSKLKPKKYGDSTHIKHSDPDGGPVKFESVLQSILGEKPAETGD